MSVSNPASATQSAGETESFDDWYVLSAFQRFVRQEGLPLYEGSALENMATLPLADWERRGGKAAYTRLGDQEDRNLILTEIPPGGSLKPEHHLYDSVMYVMSGRGATTFWQEGEPKRTVEWHEGSLLAIPLNVWHQEFNASGSEPCRMFFATNMCYQLNLYNNVDFIFNNPYQFNERFSYGMEGFAEKQKKWNIRTLETNFVSDIRSMPLDAYPERGNRTSVIRLAMAGTSLGIHVMGASEGTYVTAHRHGPGAHVIVVGGNGYELMWRDGEERRKVAAEPYAVVAPKHNEYHQHMNSGKGEYRMLAFRGYNLQYGWGKQFGLARGAQRTDPNAPLYNISFASEDPEIRRDYYRELEKNGVTLRLEPTDQSG